MKIEEFKGMKFKRVCDICETNRVGLLLSDNDTMHNLGVLTHQYGATAGACYVAAVLYVMENGAEAAIAEGMALLKQAAINTKRKDILDKVHDAENWTAWGVIPKSAPFMQSKKAPVEVPKSVWGKHAGYMNFLLLKGLQGLEVDTNTKHLAAKGVMDILDFMLTRKTGRKIDDSRAVQG